MRLMRFAIGRWLVHCGLRVMPPGPARAELTDIFWQWRTHVTVQVRAGARAAEHATRAEAFRNALQEAIDLSELMIAQGDGDPIDHQTFIFAVQSLLPFVVSLALPCPMVLPLQNGGVGAEWHDLGMNVELRFRKLYDVYAVVEDAHNIVLHYHGRDPYLQNVEPALRELSHRFTA